MAVTPTCDALLTWYFDDQGELTVDWVLEPGGDGALVGAPGHEEDRLLQDLTRWFLSPVGSNPFDPTWGNPFWAQLGRPGLTTNDQYLDMIDQAEMAFAKWQATAAAAGYLTLNQQLDHFENSRVIMGGSTLPDGSLTPIGTLTIIVTVVTKAQQAYVLQVPFGSAQGGLAA